MYLLKKYLPKTKKNDIAKIKPCNLVITANPNVNIANNTKINLLSLKYFDKRKNANRVKLININSEFTPLKTKDKI